MIRDRRGSERNGDQRSRLAAIDGDITWHTQSTIWGTTIAASNGGIDCPLRFPGQYFDPETGHHYNNQRHYNPDIGRYLAKDPLGLHAGPHPTIYAHNPITLIDPLRLICGEFELNDLGERWYESPNHLLYGVGSAQGHRITHVLEHGSPDATGKPTHTIFDTGRRGILETVDDAWLQRGGAEAIRTEGNRTVYERIPMGYQIETGREQNITTVMRNGDEMITAFPQGTSS